MGDQRQSECCNSSVEISHEIRQMATAAVSYLFWPLRIRNDLRTAARTFVHQSKLKIFLQTVRKFNGNFRASFTLLAGHSHSFDVLSDLFAKPIRLFLHSPEPINKERELSVRSRVRSCSVVLGRVRSYSVVFGGARRCSVVFMSSFRANRHI